MLASEIVGFEALLQKAERQACDEKAMEFVSKVRMKVWRFGSEAEITPSQLSYLKSIAGED